MRKVTSSGGVVIKNINNLPHILLIIFKDGSGLAFPKGKVDKGESLEQTAIREVSEETGLNNLSIIKKLGIVRRPSTEKSGELVSKTIHLYLMKDKTYIHKKSDEDYGWFTFDEAVKRIAFKQEAEFLKKVFGKLT